MIQNVLNIPDNISFNKYIYEKKPIQFENGNIYSENWNDNFKMDGTDQYFIQQENKLLSIQMEIYLKEILKILYIIDLCYEAQNNESEDFRNLLEEIIVEEGGIESGFKKIREEK